MAEKIIVDGSNAVFGRMASFVAKELLKGVEVDVINAEKIVISGDKKKIIEKIRHKRSMGSGSSMKGPKFIRQSDRLVKRMIRGMLPRDKARGREAFDRLKCHIGVGKITTEGKEVKTFDGNMPQNYSTVKEIAAGLMSSGKGAKNE